MRANSWCRAAARCLPVVMVLAAASLSGCKSVTEKYIALEVWKYEKLFGHLPPGFVPPGAMPAAAPAARPCGQQQAPCQAAPCGGGDHVVGSGMAGDNCNSCQGGVVAGGMPSGAIMSPGMPAGALPVGPGDQQSTGDHLRRGRSAVRHNFQRHRQRRSNQPSVSSEPGKRRCSTSSRQRASASPTDALTSA